MARDHIAANNEYFVKTSALLTAAPITMACWFRPNAVDTDYTLIAIGLNGGVNESFMLLASGTVAGDPVRAFTRTTSAAVAATTTGFSANTWHHGCAVFASATDRRAFIDGGSKGTNATNKVPSGPDRTVIGATPQPTTLFNGRIAEAAIWNVALMDNEVAMLAAGVSPLRVRPSALVGYWPLPARAGDAIDYSGKGNTLTDTNTVGVADHAPVQPMFGYDLGWLGAFTAAGAPPPVQVARGPAQAPQHQTMIAM